MRLFFLFFLSVGFVFSNISVSEIEETVIAIYNKDDMDALKKYIDQLPEDVQNYYYGVFALEGLFDLDSKAANFYFLKCIEQTKYKEIKSAAYKAIGDSFYSGDGLDECLPLAGDAYKKAAELGLPSGLFNYAIVLNEMGEFDLAIKTMKKYSLLKDADLKDYAKKLILEWQNETDSR